MKISAIAAMSENWVIGRDNALPWKLQDDLIRFRKITMNHPIIMGRKTFESIGRILPGRDHFIVSRNTDYKVPGAVVVSSLEQAIRLCKNKSNESNESNDKTDECFIIGGAEIYRQSLPFIDRLYLTLIHQQISGDAYFPHFEFAITFRTVSQEEHLDAPLPYSFLILEKLLLKINP